MFYGFFEVWLFCRSH